MLTDSTNVLCVVFFLALCIMAEHHYFGPACQKEIVAEVLWFVQIYNFFFLTCNAVCDKHH